MEDQVFDQFARESAEAPTRRTVVRGLAAVLGAAGVGLGLSLDAEAGKKKKHKQKKKKKEKKKKNKTYECEYKDRVCATPTNPCQDVSCENHKCVTSNVANGAACGNGLECDAGQCVCPGGTCVVKVTPDDMSGWGFFDEQTNQPIDATMAFGPDQPPYGVGSARLKIDTDPEKKTVGARILNGTKLADLSELSYWTYVQSSAGNTAPSFQIGITRDIEDPLDGFESRLVFVPSRAGAVTPGAWQEWDLMDSAIPPSFKLGKGQHPDVPHCSGAGTDWCTFEDVLEHYPNIAINPIGASPDNPGTGWGFIGAMVGSNEGAVNAYVDGVTIAVAGSGTRTVYNFEPS